MNSYMQCDNCYCTDLDPIWGDGFFLFHRGKENFGEAGRMRVELNLDQGFSSLELLTFWTRSFFVVLYRVGCGVWPLHEVRVIAALFSPGYINKNCLQTQPAVP